LDTHVIVWLGYDSPHLSPRVRSFLLEEASEVYVSAASAWEIAMKVRLGRWPEANALEAAFSEKMKQAGFTTLPVTVDDALRAGRLPGAHGDPFDRLVAAQALAMDISLVSIDVKMDQFGVRRIW
jgi:PIN domain nuclease of toxin-antitoxin system